jgi:transcriptional regulator, XRE family|nr:helix-turn-helix domain-containing protein [uncultured Leptotrichia sp.]
MKINEKLKDLRLKNNMTQRELAEKLGISIPTLQKYEYGTLKIKNEVILSLCDIFDISPDDFFYEKRNDVFKETDNLLKELDKFKNTDIIKELDEIEKKEYKKNRALLIIEKIRKDMQKKEEREKERQIQLSDYRRNEINEKMETFKDFYYYEDSLEIEQLEFKNLFSLIQFLMSYFDLNIEINSELPHSPYVEIYSEKLKIRYEIDIEDFEKFFTFLTDDFIHNFFNLLSYNFYNVFENDKEEE